MVAPDHLLLLFGMAPSVSARQLAPVVNPDLVVDDANSDRVAADLLDVQAVMGLEPDPVAIDDAQIEIGTWKIGAARCVMRSNAPSGGVSRMS
jgi:hypothetical protein